MFFNNCNWCRRPCCCRCVCECNKNENKNHCDMNDKDNWNKQDKCCCNIKFEQCCCDKKCEKDYCDKDHDKDCNKHDDKFDRCEKKTDSRPDKKCDDKDKKDDDKTRYCFNSTIYSFYPENNFDRDTEERFNSQNSYVDYSNDENEDRNTRNENQPKAYVDDRKQEVDNNYCPYTPKWDDDKFCKHNTGKNKFCYNRHCRPVSYICFPIFK